MISVTSLPSLFARRRAFTLTEILVVLGIVLLLSEVIFRA